MKLSRRDLFAIGGAGALAAALPAGAVAQRSKRAKNIIFCVSDGMAVSIPTMADHFQQLQFGKQSYWRWLMNQEFVVNGLQDTRSLNSVVTDSSAASSAWGSGRHVWNGAVNMFPDGTELRTLTQIMSEAGIKCGLITTATITHATPAGFAVNCEFRDQEEKIAERYLSNSGVDVLMGGGSKFFLPEKRADKRDLAAEFQRAGYTLTRDRNSMLGLQAGKILGLYSESHMPYTVDHVNDAGLLGSTPNLAEMTKVAIENLSQSKNGFLLQIEGAKIDHGCHSNDLAAALYDQIAFEDAVRVAVEYALKDRNTLVVVTADHATGGPALNGAGTEYIDSTAGLKLLAGMKASYGMFTPDITRMPTVSNIQDSIHKHLAIQLKREDAEAIATSAKGTHPLGANMFMRSLNTNLAAILGNYTKVGWTSGNHTSDHVLVTAMGPGKEHFAGLMQNIDFFNILLAQKGLKHSNPTMTFEEARRHKRTDAVVSEDEFA